MSIHSDEKYDPLKYIYKKILESLVTRSNSYSLSEHFVNKTLRINNFPPQKIVGAK